MEHSVSPSTKPPTGSARGPADVSLGSPSLPPPSSSSSLTKQIVIASVVSIVALAIVCGLGLSSLRRLSLQNDAEMAQRLALLDESEVFQLLLYQKGFAVDFMFTGDERWLRELSEGRREFQDWLLQAKRNADSIEERQLLDRIGSDYQRLDEAHAAMIAGFRQQKQDQVRQQHQKIFAQLNELLKLSEQFVRTSAAQARSERAVVQRTMRRDTALLVGSSLLGMVTSLVVGFLVARRVARPIYELQLQVASAAQRTRIEVRPGRAGLPALGEHVSAIVRRIEETDAEIVEQRRRLIQSEKMSAIGEVSAKLAHEILNPLAGIKAAVQLLARGRPVEDGSASTVVRDTAQLMSQEVARVEQLVRRMLTYARPLQPRLSTCAVAKLLSMAEEAARIEIEKAGVKVRRHEEAALPPVEVDQALVTQVLTNFLVNAAQASEPGSDVVIESRRAQIDGKEAIELRVLDEGTGIAPAVLPNLFQPFVTTKPRGNGLGLAISQNIAREHGGQISAHNRDGGKGAVFSLLLPLVHPLDEARV
ncbi:MAG: ATP-binding protein [Polyangia bacterium]|jgi:signal transduction histidine kinase